MSNALAVFQQASDQLPASLRTPEAMAAAQAANAAAVGGLKGMGYPYISKKGSKFFVYDGDEQTLIVTPATGTDPALPKALIKVIVLAGNPNESRQYYKDDFKEGERKAPDCSSTDGLVPDANIATKQSPTCAGCPQAVWGAKISKASGKPIPACSSTKQLAVMAADAPNYIALGLQLTTSDFESWKVYINDLNKRGAGIIDVVTNITFDATVAFPKLLFSFGGFVPDSAKEELEDRRASDAVQAIINPRRVAALPVPGAGDAASRPPMVGLPARESDVALAATVGAPVDPVPSLPPGETTAVPPLVETTTRKPRRTRAEMQAAADAAAQAAGAGQPVPPIAAALPPVTPAAPPAADPFAGLPPNVKTTCDTAGAPGSPGFNAVYAALAGKPYVAPAAAVPAYDPWAGLAPTVKITCDTAGAPGSVGFNAVYLALAGKPYGAPDAAAAVPATPVAPAAVAATPAVQAQPAVEVSSAVNSLRERLAAQAAKAAA